MGSLFKKPKKSQKIGPQPDEIREQRLEEVKSLVEKMLFDLGMLIAGNDPPLEAYVQHGVADSLRQSMAPFRATGDAMRPNFGEYGELQVEGNLLDMTHTITANLEFDDQSVRETAGGHDISVPKRRMVMSLIIDPSCRMIQSFTLTPKL